MTHEVYTNKTKQCPRLRKTSYWSQYDRC